MSVDRNKNLFGQSRWHIISLLRKKSMGVKELSSELGMTPNGIRPHLASLERDNLVRQVGVKLSGGQPAHIFELTGEAELFFPKAYGVLLSHMLTEIRSSLDDSDFHKLLTSTALRLARNWPKATGNKVNQIQTGVDVLNELGGLAEISEEDNKYFIQGYSCPLSEATKTHPEICFLAQMLLEDLTDLKFERCCTYGEKPKCRFQAL
ncbi:metalloregulator ArsR/SmtB family transcription factor [Roseivirga sp. E12]|uniref:helix-turn-helix transcriptional regulator n=1 Tax=Roseivirga sp. E12 TaxID=2819237 RepID=UPI002105B8A1|nr:ArsR family transcriptional regulator [Roseivirga sp. E12]